VGGRLNAYSLIRLDDIGGTGYNDDNSKRLDRHINAELMTTLVLTVYIGHMYEVAIV